MSFPSLFFNNKPPMNLIRYCLPFATAAVLFSAAACSSIVNSDASPDAALATADAASEFQADAGDPQNPMGVDPNLQDDGSPFVLLHSGLGKEQFLENNWAELQRMVLRINAKLQTQYPNLRVLTTADVVLCLYAEMGIQPGGTVNPTATHSNGERGLVPLPENISYWIGNDAPAWDTLHSIEDNVFAFTSYLGQLKNKEVRQSEGRTLYRDLFLHPDIVNQFLPEARVVAGIIHGYFFSGAYTEGSTVPFDAILQGLADGTPLPSILEGTGYKHATPERIFVLEGRQQNLDEASVLWSRLLTP